MQDQTLLPLRHAVATVAYRGAKAIRAAPSSFAHFDAGSGAKTPIEILAHVGDLYAWALSQAKGEEVWVEAGAKNWEDEISRFFATLKTFDDFIASGNEIHAPIEKLFQGPIADSLTHVGQIALLRRLFGSPIMGENYFKANIAIGAVGDKQTSSKFEFE